MMHKALLAVLATLALAPATHAQTAPAALPDDQAQMKAHVLFLASDAMRGREAASPEYRIAAEYVAAQFYAAGLVPAGQDGGYLQKVPLVAYRAADHGDVVLTRKGAGLQPLLFGEDFTPGAVAGAARTTLDAPIVFVGHGIVAPRYKRAIMRASTYAARSSPFSLARPRASRARNARISRAARQRPRLPLHTGRSARSC
jgi:hypothetical protein